MLVMIHSFSSRSLQKVWRGKRSRKLPVAMQSLIRRKLRMLNNVEDPSHIAALELKTNKSETSCWYALPVKEGCHLLFLWEEQGRAHHIDIVQPTPSS